MYMCLIVVVLNWGAQATWTNMPVKNLVKGYANPPCKLWEYSGTAI